MVKRNNIQTVLGKISPEDLGFCHCHEHIFLENQYIKDINSDLIIDNYQKTVEELESFKKAGGISLVDAQPIGCGRNAEKLMMASTATEVNIIASTGFHKMDFYPEDHWIYSIKDSDLAELFIQEIRDGMFIKADTDFPSEQVEGKAGIIKIALEAEGIKENNTKLFYAAAEAAIKTGVPILCHTENRKDAEDTIDFLDKQGVQTDSIILCHLDRTAYDFEFHKEVAQMGVYLEYDTIGRYKYHSDEEEAKLIMKMIADGYEDQILLGLDTTRKRMKSYGGSIGLAYIAKIFIPLLIKHGLNERYKDILMIKNPSKALSIKRTKSRKR